MKKCSSFSECKSHSTYESTDVRENDPKYGRPVMRERFRCMLCGRTFEHVYLYLHTIDTTWDVMDKRTQDEHDSVLETNRSIAP